jgi:hypothetical protein
MKTNVSFSDFTNAFRNSNRAEQFSYEALELIFDYLDDYERETGEEIEFDMIAICCEWAEADYKDLFNTYPIECEADNPTDQEVNQAVMDYLSDNTTAYQTAAGTIVYVQF